LDEEGKQDWSSSNEDQIAFWESIKKVKDFFENMPQNFQTPAIYDFSFIQFPQVLINDGCIISPNELLSEFSDNCLFAIFYKATFYGDIIIGNSKFKIDLDFRECLFKDSFSLVNCKIKGIDFSNATFEKKTSIKKSIFESGTKFNNAIFHDDITLEELHFKDHVNLTITSIKKSIFNDLTFEKIASFGGALFSDSVSFKDCNFNDFTDFTETSFNEQAFFSRVFFHDVYFIGTIFLSNTTFIFLKADYFIMRNPIIKNLKINNSFIKNSDIDRLFSTSKTQDKHKLVSLSKKHISDRQTARFLKNLYDNQKNIPNSNQLFAIEQDYFIDEINRKNILDANKIPTLATLYLNKWVSNFGTDWIRSLLLLFMLSYLFMRLYIDFDVYLPTKDEHIKHFTQVSDIQYIWTMLISWGLIYLSTFFKSQKLIFWILIIVGFITSIAALGMYDNVLAMQNYIIQLTNPINAFKNMNLYDGIEIYGAIVRITVVTIIYQLIVAFRQNTRRK
jgi:uncharacterized protein YjbI with pentapeptide repeats